MSDSTRPSSRNIHVVDPNLDTGMKAGPTAQERRRVLSASLMGTAVEWYDFFIYGSAAALIFGPQFFPTDDPLAGTLAAFATFAVGFIARPFGGVIMGHFGDRVGRKSMLMFSMMQIGERRVGKERRSGWGADQLQRAWE